MLFVTETWDIFLGWDVRSLFSSPVLLSTQTDSIHQQQQQASGRTKTFDQLAEEQKTASTGRDMEELPVKSKDKEIQPEAFEEKITTQGSKQNFNSNGRSLRYEI